MASAGVDEIQAAEPAEAPGSGLRDLDPATAGAAYAQALLDLGFDHARYRAEHRDLADLAPLHAAWHYHVAGRRERRAAHFKGAFRRARARAAELATLDEAERRLIRQDLAAARLRDASLGEPDHAVLDDLLEPSPDSRPLVVVADSHGAFYLVEDVLRAADLLPAPLLCTGASARGLGNPNSHLRHAEIILRQLRNWNGRLQDAVVLLKFGQVDLEFVHDFRRIRAGVTRFDLAAAEAFAHECVELYAKLLGQLRAATPARLVVSSALPPALSDAAVRQGYVNAHIAEAHGPADAETVAETLRRMEMPDQRVRTGLARTYNAALRETCTRLGLEFLDDFTPLLGPDGVIDPALVAWHGGTDHHLCFASPASRAAAGRMAREIAGRL